jgi:probable biosynthetic protein (TIGR04098 family)
MSANSYMAYPLTLGLPHTNRYGFAEPQLLMYAGHFQWNSISSAFGKPMTEITTKEGKPIYATFFYIDESFPRDKPLAGFHLDHELLFLNRIRHYKSMSIDGEILFDRKKLITKREQERFSSNPSLLRGKHPFIRMCNVFISRASNNDFLKITTPEASVSFDKILPLPPDENPYGITREAAQNMTFGSFEGAWTPIDLLPDYHVSYIIDPDRDTNGAGLIYFAQYVAFLVTAERMAIWNNIKLENIRLKAREHPRTLLQRKLGYFGNVRLDDTLELYVSAFVRDNQDLGFRCRIVRQSDKKMIALSESVQAFVDSSIEREIIKRTS